MEHIYTDKEFMRMMSEYDKAKYKCRCGHKMIIPPKMDKVVCDWCGKYVFKDKKKEFEYRLREKMKWNIY